MICVISQPRFFPGVHYLHRLLVADVFCILDTVQFNPRHEENRARLKGPDGPLWLSAPMTRKGREQRIAETRPGEDRSWVRKAKKTLEGCYGKTPWFETYAPAVFEVLDGEYDSLVELDVASWRLAREALRDSCRVVRASELPVHGSGPELLLELTAHLGCDTYLSGGFGREYLDARVFRERGIDVRYHEYRYPEYPQRFGEFVPYLSYLDMLFNVGLDRDAVAAGGSCVPAD